MTEIDEQTILKVEKSIVWQKLNKALLEKIDMVESRFKSGLISEEETLHHIAEINDTLDFLRKNNNYSPTEDEVAVYAKYKHQLSNIQANK